MLYNQSKLTLLITIFITVSFVHPVEIFAKKGRDGRRSFFLKKKQKSLIKDAASQRDLDKIRILARQQPYLVESIAELYIKHSGVKGKEAGEVAAVIVKAINADIQQAGELAAAVYQRKKSTIEDAVDIAGEVTEALNLNDNIDKFSLFIGHFADQLDLKDKNAAEFVVLVIKKYDYHGYEAGKIAGLVARGINSKKEEIETIVNAVLAELKPGIKEADEMASTVALETGERIKINTGSSDEAQ